MAQQPPHVPKFGNWDNDNTPYTIYFENARKERNGSSGARLNPNDPEENPEAFGNGKRRIMNPNDPEDNPEAFMSHVAPPSPLNMHPRRPPLDTNHYDEPKSPILIGSSSNRSLSSSSHVRKISDIPTQRAASVPRFGAWDDHKDPRLGEGFTVIFNKRKEEKQMPSANFPVPPQHSTFSDAHAHAHALAHPQQYSDGTNIESSRSKICCCFFSS